MHVDWHRLKRDKRGWNVASDFRERFWMKVAVAGPDDCWLWMSTKNAHGYGVINSNKRVQLAHRVSWCLEHALDIPGRMAVCHSCDTPACVNPKHLWLGTQRDNMRDAAEKKRTVFPQRIGYWQASNLFCKNGHWWSGENNLFCQGRRWCRACVREKSRAQRAAAKQRVVK